MLSLNVNHLLSILEPPLAMCFFYYCFKVDFRNKRYKSLETKDKTQVFLHIVTQTKFYSFIGFELCFLQMDLFIWHIVLIFYNLVDLTKLFRSGFPPWQLLFCLFLLFLFYKSKHLLSVVHIYKWRIFYEEIE